MIQQWSRGIPNTEDDRFQDDGDKLELEVKSLRGAGTLDLPIFQRLEMQ